MGFIQDFLQYNSGNECPRDYILWAGYGALSATIGRRIFIDLKQFHVIANLYILLVGHSGGRKTFALDKAVDLLITAVPDTVFAGDNETYQGVITFLAHENQERQFMDHNKELVTYHPYCIFAPELMDYLQLNPIGMVTFLTNIYDRKHYIYRLKHEENILENTYVVMCACTTPVWLTEQVKAKQFAEGYGRRTIIVCNERIIRKEPSYDLDSQKAKSRCIQRLKDIQKFTGECVIDEEAKRWFWDTWYTKLKDPDDPFLKNWYSSKHINLLKVAMLTSISERDDLRITLPYLQLALGLLDEVEKNLSMVTSLMGRSEVAQPMSLLITVLRNHGGEMTKKELMMSTFKEFKNPTEQWQALEFLKTTQQVQINVRDFNGVKREVITLIKK